MPEIRKFTAHEQHLYNTILRQAGTLQKGVLEGVMNSVDAGATRIDVSYDDKRVSISDDGKGFKNRQEVLEYFEVFGNPHQPGDAVFGEFRLGRGQLMAFGKNVWQSNKFKMTVDIKQTGLSYELETLKKKFPGCQVDIELYTRLGAEDSLLLEESLKSMLRYVATPIFLNGTQISRDPAKEKWDHVTEEAYIRLKNTGVISVYNLGVHVQELSAYDIGSGGVVVSRKALKLNFARNAVMVSGKESCPVWKKISPKLKTEVAKKLAKESDRLNDAGRAGVLRRLKRGEGSEADLESKLLTDVRGRHWSIRDVLDILFRLARGRNRYPAFTVGPHGSSAADKVMQTQMAFVFSDRTTEYMGLDGDDEYKTIPSLLESIYRKVGSPHWSRYKGVEEVPYRPLWELVDDMDSTTAIIEPAKYTVREKVWLDIIRHGQSRLYWHIKESGRRDVRTVVLGSAANYLAWTDGSTYVAVARDYLQSLKFDFNSFCHLGHTMVHEYCHGNSSACEHAHPPEFYQLFHDCSAEAIASFACYAMAELPKAIKRHKAKLGRLAARRIDQADKLPLRAAEAEALHILAATVG